MQGLLRNLDASPEKGAGSIHWAVLFFAVWMVLVLLRAETAFGFRGERRAPGGRMPVLQG